MDDGSIEEGDIDSESGPTVDQQRVAPLYSSTPGEQCNIIAPESEYWGTNERSPHSVHNNERFIAAYDVETRARELASPPREKTQEPILRRIRGIFPLTLLNMVDMYTKWTDAEWEQLRAILNKEWTSAYEEAVSWGIDSQSIKFMVIN